MISCWSQGKPSHGLVWTPNNKRDSIVQVRYEQITLSWPKVNCLDLPLILPAVLEKQYASPWQFVNCRYLSIPSFEKDFENHVRKTGEQSLSSGCGGESIFARRDWMTQGGIVLILSHGRRYTQADLITASGKPWCSRFCLAFWFLVPFWCKQRRMHAEKKKIKKKSSPSS